MIKIQKKRKPHENNMIMSLAQRKVKLYAFLRSQKNKILGVLKIKNLFLLKINSEVIFDIIKK